MLGQNLNHNMQPHSREWFRQLAQTQGGYFYPWNQVLQAPGGEQLFDALLEPLLRPDIQVLEAGCAEGKDAARFASRVAGWSGYDFIPEFLEVARQRVRSAHFVQWHSAKEPPPFEQKFDVFVSRRGPSSLIDHLPLLAKPKAKVLCIHPWDENSVAKVRERLRAIALEPSAQWFIAVKGWLPTWEDFLAYRRFMGDQRADLELAQEWRLEGVLEGFPMEERRYIWQAEIP